MNNENRGNALRWCIVIVLIMIAETFVFNLAHWRTTSHDEVSTANMVVGSGLKNGNGSFEIDDPENAFVEISIKANNGVYPRLESVKISVNSSEMKERESVDYSVFLKKNGVWRNSSQGAWYDPSSDVFSYTASPITQYAMLPGYATDSTRVYFKGEIGKKVVFESVEFNRTIPFTISITRVGIMLLVGAFAIYFRPRSLLYQKIFDWSDIRQMISICAMGILVCIGFVALCTFTHTEDARFNPVFNHWIDPYQYQHLADAFLNGHLYLDLPVDPQLADLSNPYDYEVRHGLGAEGSQIFWDYAFFDGKYYTYFGALPALLLFVPFQAMTGHWMPTSLAIMVFGVIAIVLLLALVVSIAKRYFADTASWGMVLLMSIFAVLAIDLTYFGFMTDFYSVPIVASLAFTFGGLLLWVHARKKYGNLSSVRIFLGSLLMACNLGCRPQFLIACLLAFPLFWDEITVSRELFSKKGLVSTICAFAPFFIMAVPWMWYNNARFGSLLNFGANYNLTGFNMTEVHPSRFAIPGMWFMQLFQLPLLSGAFPFVQTINNTLPSPSEPSLGGYFMIVPAALIGLLFFVFRETLKKARVYGLAWILVVSIVVVSLVDVSSAGITNRYHGDFAWMAALLAILTIFSIESIMGRFENGGGCLQIRSAFITVLVAFILFTVFIYGFGSFASGRYSALSTTNPDLYLTVKSWFMGFYAGQA
ncbi:hypothetical protein [Bifidobacterium tissieri]|uniref:Glycosyltransferase n=1 Tax=Bifidobacterium tissieri TaxID=1630162 RepID=A0A5M9ZSL9_9BIFI|nr:hypothetical protein [Bifidobacterium tissieri]KAA8827337.1 hypothetical protein EMO89_10955 [Bifidobacterium tissieri]KAA8830636.1 hypothetical protein EM849_09205 [Bifidobacterium tissieri]